MRHKNPVHQSHTGRSSGRWEETHTRLPNEHFLRRADGTLPHGVVHAEADLVALVLAQICKENPDGRFNESVEIKPETPGGSRDCPRARRRDGDVDGNKTEERRKDEG